MFAKNNNTIIKNKTMRKESLKKISLAAALSFGAFVAYAGTASAADLTSVMVKIDRMKTSTATTGTVCATPTSTATEAKVQVTFPAGFTVSTTAANWSVDVANLPNGTTAWPSIAAPSAAPVGQVVIFGSGDLTPATQYCFNFTNTAALTTPGSAANSLVGSVTTTTSVPANIDTGQFALAVISDDQIVVSATVPPIFTFALSGNTDTFTAALSPSAITSTSGRTVSIATNSDSGWVAWVKDSQQGLQSASAGNKIATSGTVDNTPTTLTNGADGYGLVVAITTDGALGDGTVTQASNYGAEYAAGASQVGALSGTLTPIAASSGSTDGDVLTLTERATISAVTPAASDYTDTLTVIGAGRF